MFFGISLQLWAVCLLLVIGRIIDMSLASLRTVYTVRSRPVIASLLGFFEAFSWFIVVKAALDYVIVNQVKDTLFIALAYSLGFALGTLLGGILANIVVKTKINVHIVLSKKNEDLLTVLKEQGFGQTIISAQGTSKKETNLVFVETDSKNLKTLKDIIDKYDKNAFISIHEVKQVFGGYFANNK